MYLNDHKIALAAMEESVKDAEAIKELMLRAGIPVNNVTLVLIDSLRNAAFTAGRKAMREECQRAVIDALHPRDTWQPSYLGGYTDAMRLALGAIRALPGKEGE